MKKAILFTMMSYFLFVGILTVAFSYQEQSKKMQQHLSDMNYLRKIYYMESDIADDFYDLIGMDMNIDRSSTTAWLVLRDIGLEDYTTSFTNYQTYMTTTYANLTNTKMNLSINPEFSINNKANFTVNNTEISITGLDALDQIIVHINSEEPLYSLLSANTIRNMSNFNVVLYEGSTVLSNVSDPTRFTLEWNGTQRVVSVDFVNNELIISRASFGGTPGLQANASYIKLTYNDTTNIDLTTGLLQTASFRGVSKDGVIVLAQG